MINVHVIVWLFTGGMIGSLGVLENSFSVAGLFVGLIAVTLSLTIFGLLRRQPVR